MNSRDLNPIKNIWSIIDETMYKHQNDARAEEAQKNVTFDTLQEIAHSKPRPSENVTKNKGFAKSRSLAQQPATHGL